MNQTGGLKDSTGAGEVSPLLEALRAVARHYGWNDDTRRACEDLITAMRAGGAGDIAIAEALICADVREEEAWLILGYVSPPIVASRRGLRKRRITLACRAVAWPIVVWGFFWRSDYPTLLLYLGAALFYVFLDWVSLERRKKRAYRI